MSGGGGSIESGEPDFQIAPMIDVLLVMLVFFVAISTTQIDQVDTRVKVPVAPDSAERKPDPNQVLLNVIWKESEGKVILNYAGKDYENQSEELVEMLQKRGENNPKFEVIIRADKNTPAKEVRTAIGIAAQVTAKVSFATVNRAG
ncbi:MAG: biopolymer transporter ExbD [Verrucomicrobiales bacterium]|nr:biopolymer transporter ExbD [Verrucomicrobiales bacterium]